MKPIIQLTKSGIVFSGSEDDLNNLRELYDKQYCIKLSGFLNPELLKYVQRKIEESGFYTDKYKLANSDAVDHRLNDETVNNLLEFLLNEQKLFWLVEKLTGCKKILSFNGGVYSLVPNCGHYDSWHQDISSDELVSLSINLSTDVYLGGILQIRNYHTKEILYEIANTGFGDAILFCVAPNLEHKVTDVEGTVSKTAFPGWFRSKPNYLSELKRGSLEKASV